MSEYNPLLPLIFLHIPKTAGTSLRDVFIKWYDCENIIQCYNKDTMRVQQYKALKAGKPNTILYGHFSNASRCIPEIQQIVTILRNPFSRAVSEYFHRKRHKTLKDGNDTLTKYILNTKHSTLIDRVSFKIDNTNYKEMVDSKFLYIGITEKIEESILELAQVLGKQYKQNSLPKLNVAPGYDEDIPTTLEHQFNEIYQLEVDIYNYVSQKIKS